MQYTMRSLPRKGPRKPPSMIDTVGAVSRDRHWILMCRELSLVNFVASWASMPLHGRHEQASPVCLRGEAIDRRIPCIDHFAFRSLEDLSHFQPSGR